MRRWYADLNPQQTLPGSAACAHRTSEGQVSNSKPRTGRRT
jgi:hypothetical protein